MVFGAARLAGTVASNPLTGVIVGGADAAMELVSIDAAVPPAIEAIAFGVADSLGGAG